MAAAALRAARRSGVNIMALVVSEGWTVPDRTRFCREDTEARHRMVPGFDAGWFERGVLEVLDGDAAGLKGVIKRDEPLNGGRAITLWSELRARVRPGDLVRLTAGCDKRAETCRFKFDNLINFQGFPDIPGNDWTTAVPTSSNSAGGSRR